MRCQHHPIGCQCQQHERDEDRIRRISQHADPDGDREHRTRGVARGDHPPAWDAVDEDADERSEHRVGQE